MALDPLEWGMIAVFAVVIFLWGPQKIPEIARMIGRARREFETASKEVRTMTDSIGASAATPSALPQDSTPSSGKTGDQILIETAKRIGIDTQGKTREQIQAEIVARARMADGAAAADG